MKKREIIVRVLYIFVMLISALLGYYSKKIFPSDSSFSLALIALYLVIFSSPIFIALIYKWRQK